MADKPRRVTTMTRETNSGNRLRRHPLRHKSFADNGDYVN